MTQNRIKLCLTRLCFQQANLCFIPDRSTRAQLLLRVEILTNSTVFVNAHILFLKHLHQNFTLSLIIFNFTALILKFSRNNENGTE